ncbi:unnamed protein product [Blumeria hordei]|uniref:Probable glucan endo-1,3-beta-glucosidase eglC n=2 Tax=Blumeria hordei TaxID=2867405 RepID=A0A383UYS6_BLUHO|nr:unnamed protein product [Blumeria hordei]
MRHSILGAMLASLASSNAVFQGFNYGATKSDGYTVRVQSDFQTLFHRARNLPGTSGFTSARLYTTVQGGTANEPTSAIPAAISENTSLLLGLWASAGPETMNNEITALKSAIAQYGTSFTKLVAGISVGSEDLYRISPQGVESKSNVGAEPSAIANYMSQVRSALAGTALSGTPIGHVDTWTAWVNGSNQAVVDASDWIGVDAYPYFESTQANSVENGATLFNKAMDATRNAAKGKPLWITETGWPVGGPKSGAAETGSTNAKSYWDQVGCPNFGTVNTWWYTLDDTDGSTSPGEQFGVVKGETPNFDLSCSKRASDLDSGATSASSPGSNDSDVTNGTIISPSTGNGTRSSPSSGLTPDKGSGGRPTGTAGLQPTGTSGAQPSGGAGFKPNNSVIDIGTPSATTTGNLGTETQNAAALVSGSMMGVVGALVFGLVM